MDQKQPRKAPVHHQSSTNIQSQKITNADGEHQLIAIHQGPLPSPTSLKEYNQAGPDYGDRVLKMAETEQANRWAYENKALEMESEDRKADRYHNTINRVMAFCLVLGLFAVVVLSAYWGLEGLASAAIGGLAISSILSGWFNASNQKAQ
jgi:uncharacterized membrane protein